MFLGAASPPGNVLLCHPTAASSLPMLQRVLSEYTIKCHAKDGPGLHNDANIVGPVCSTADALVHLFPRRVVSLCTELCSNMRKLGASLSTLSEVRRALKFMLHEHQRFLQPIVHALQR